MWEMINEEFEDTKAVVKIWKSKKVQQHNGQQKKDKRTNNDLQALTQKFTMEQHEPHETSGWTRKSLTTFVNWINIPNQTVYIVLLSNDNLHLGRTAKTVHINEQNKLSLNNWGFFPQIINMSPPNHLVNKLDRNILRIHIDKSIFRVALNKLISWISF